MLTTIIGALLPIVVILLLGFFSGWHKDFTGDQATILNRMVMLYALPLLLFGSTVSISRIRLLENVPLALAVATGMVGSFLVVLLAARFIFQRDLGTSTLQALTIGGPAVPFVGVSVLGYLFGPANESIPVISASLAMNLVQVPVCLILLSAAATRSGDAKAARPSLLSHVIAAVREPIVWAPILAIILIICGIRLPKAVTQSMLLLGQATGGVALFASGVMLFARRVSFNWTVALNAFARNLIVPTAFWGALVVLTLPPAAIREAVITLAIPNSCNGGHSRCSVQDRRAGDGVFAPVQHRAFHSDHAYRLYPCALLQSRGCRDGTSREPDDIITTGIATDVVRVVVAISPNSRG